jgi:hypothetical protein
MYDDVLAGLARTIFIYIYGVCGYMWCMRLYYGVCGYIYIYGVCMVMFGHETTKNTVIYGIRCIYTVLANPRRACVRVC